MQIGSPKMFVYWTLSIIGLAINPGKIQGLKAYDCDLPGTKMEALDLRKAEDCPDPTSDFLPEESVDVQIIQTDSEISWTAHQCQVQVSRSVTRCGYNSITYGSRPTQWMKIVPLSSEECAEGIAKKEITFEGRTYRDLKLGVTKKATYFSYGRVDDHGNCETTTFVRDDHTYRKSYEFTTLLIHLNKWTARVSKRDDTITFRESHLREQFSAGSTQDAHYGTLVWDTHEQGTCEDGISEFYRGTVLLHPHKNPDAQDWTGSVAILGSGDEALGTHTQHLGLILGTAVRICQRKCYEVTSMPSYVVCGFLQGAPQLPDARFQPRMLDDIQHLSLDVMARSDYQMVTSMLYNEKRLARIIHKACQREREIKANKLAMIAGGNEYALHNEFGYAPGLQVTAAGPVVAYIQHCVGVDVVHAGVPNCTHEVPVRAEGAPDTSRIRYMNTRTFVLSDYPTIVTCSEEMPVRWVLNGRWVCSYPEPRSCAQEPMRLGVDPQPSHVSSAWTSMLNPGGVVSEEQKLLRRRFINEHHLRDAVEVETIRNSMDNGREGSLGGTWSSKDLLRVSDEVMEWITPGFLFSIFGTYTNYVFLFLTASSIILGVLSALGRCLVQMKLQGWRGGRTLADGCLAACNVLTFPKRLLQELLRSNSREIERLYKLFGGVVPEGPAEDDAEAGGGIDTRRSGVSMRQVQEPDPSPAARAPPRPAEEEEDAFLPPPTYDYTRLAEETRGFSS